MTTLVVVVAAVIMVAAILYVFLARSPEQTATHESPAPEGETTSERLYRGTERPAGPDAEPS